MSVLFVIKLEFKKRVDQMSIKGLAYLYLRKFALNYNDGSFGYAISGQDFIATKLFDDSVLNTLIRKVYWSGRVDFYSS